MNALEFYFYFAQVIYLKKKPVVLQTDIQWLHVVFQRQENLIRIQDISEDINVQKSSPATLLSWTVHNRDGWKI